MDPKDLFCAILTGVLFVINKNLPNALQFKIQLVSSNDVMNVCINCLLREHGENGLSSSGDSVFYTMELPDFSDLYTPHECVMLNDAFQAINECDIWDWFRNYLPIEGVGFMFAAHPNLKWIEEHMKYDGHSGASYAWTMRVLHSIAQKGWDAHAAEVRAARSNLPPPCPCRAAKGFTTGWCGVAGWGVPGCEH